jgi:hypothetical protein
LFAGFIATTKRSDFSCSFFIGFDSSSSRCGPFRDARAVEQEISRFPCKERAYMPGSRTTQGRAGTRTIAPVRVAFRYVNSVSTLNYFNAFAARWLACRFPCQRFVPHLAMRYA